MIFFIAQQLHSWFGIEIPRAFFYYSTRMMLAAITSLLLSIFLGPAFIRFLCRLKIGQSIRKEEAPLLGELHAKKENTPTMGGLLILFSMVVSMILWNDFKHIFTLILLLTTVVLGAVGGYDDYLKLRYRNPKGLAGRKKLLIQSSLSLLIAAYFLVPAIHDGLHLGDWLIPPTIKDDNINLSLYDYATRIYIPFFKHPVLSLSGILVIVAALFYVFVITGCSNAVNLTDGLDGLAAGCLIMVAGALAMIAFLSNHMEFARYLNILYIEGSGEIAIYLCAFIGACLGFLWYNGHPAQVFMGDTGSLALGGIIGVSAVLLRREFLLALIGGIFVAEALSVILQIGSMRYRNKKRIFLCAPLHHHYEYKGWPETKIVIRFWIIGLLLAFVGLISIKFQ